MGKKKQGVWAALPRFLGSFNKLRSLRSTPVDPARVSRRPRDRSRRRPHPLLIGYAQRVAQGTRRPPCPSPATPPPLIGYTQGAAPGTRHPPRPSPPPSQEHAPCRLRLHAPRRPKTGGQIRPAATMLFPAVSLPPGSGFSSSLASSRGRCLLRTDFPCTYLVLLAIGRFLCPASPKVNKLLH